MGFGKCHLFFSCDIMKFFLFLLFLLLLFDRPQGSTIPLKRSIRALNTTLQTNFNGTYERRNPCTNAEIETTSYIASHEFRHHTKEDNWSDYTHKCSSIISSFLKALGNLVRFNHNQNGIFNFHINTSISQKQDGNCERGKWATCKSLPTITIEATDCEISPKMPCGNLPDPEPLFQKGNEATNERKTSDNEEKTTSEMVPSEPYLNQDLALQTPQCQTKIQSIQQQQDPTVVIAEGKLPEVDSMWIPDDMFFPIEETVAPSEAQVPESSILTGNMKTEDSSQAVNDFLEDKQTICEPEKISDFFEPYATYTSQLKPENYVPSQKENLEKQETEEIIPSNESFPNLPYFSLQVPELQTIPSTIPYNEDEPSEQLFLTNEEQPVGYSEQFFHNNLDKLLSNQPPADSFTSPGQTPPLPLNPREPIPTEIDQPKSTYNVEPVSLQLPPQTSSRQNEEIYAGQYESLEQQLQNEKGPESFENSNIQQTKPNSYSPETYQFDKSPFSQKPLQIPNFVPNAKKSLDYEGQTPILEFAMSYPEPPKQTLLTKNLQKKFNTFTEDDDNEYTEQKATDSDYLSELSEAQPSFRNVDAVPSDFAFSPEQDVTFSGKLSTFNVREPQTTTQSWTPQEQFLNEQTDAPSLKLQKLDQCSDENICKEIMDPVTDDEFPVPSDHYQRERPESQSLIKYADEYGDNVESESAPIQSEPELASNKPLLPFSAEKSSPLEYPTLRSPNQNLPQTAFDYDKLGPSSFEKEPQPKFDSIIQVFPEEYLTTLPPEQESVENAERVLPTFNFYQDQPGFPETKSTSSYPDQVSNDKMTTLIPYSAVADSKQFSTESFSDDYEDPLYSKPEIEQSYTPPMQYDSSAKKSFSNEQGTYETTSQPSNNQQLFASDSQMATQIPEQLKSQPRQAFPNAFFTKPPQFSEEYLNKDAMISDEYEQKPAITSYAENLSQENQPPRDFLPTGQDDLPGGQIFVPPLPADSNTAESFEPPARITTDNYQKRDHQIDFPFPSNYESEQFSPRLFTTPTSENSMIQTQIKKSTSLGELANLPPQFAEPAVIEDFNENSSNFPTEKDFEQMSEPSQFTQIHANQNNQPFSPTPFARNQYFSAEQPEAQAVAFPEYESTTSTEYQPTGKPVETPETLMSNYNSNDGFMIYPPLDQQLENGFEQESTEQFPFMQTYSGSRRDQIVPDSDALEPQSLTSVTNNDQFRPLEFQPELNQPFSDDKSSGAVSEQTLLQRSPSKLTKNQDLQFNDFRTSPIQSEDTTPYSNIPLENASLDFQSPFSEVDDFGLSSTVPPETEIYGMDMDNLTLDQQSSTQSPEPEIALSQSYDKSIDYPAKLERASQSQPSVDNYNKKIYDSYPMINSAPQPEYSSTTQTSFDEYSDSTPSIPKFNPFYGNEQPKSQNIQKKIRDYTFILPPESQSQHSLDYLTDISDDNTGEKVPQPIDFDSSFPSAVKPERLGVNNQYPENTEAYLERTQSKSNYMNELPNINFTTSNFPKTTKNKQIFQPFDLATKNPVSDSKLDSDEIASSLRPSVFPYSETPIISNLNTEELINEPSQITDIPFRDEYETQSFQDSSDNSDNDSQQSRPATAVKYDDEVINFSQAFKPQPQRSLGFADQFPDSADQQYSVSPYAAPFSEFESAPVSLQKEETGFDSSDRPPKNQPPFLSQFQRQQQLDSMTRSPEQNDFDPNLSSQIPFSPSYKTTRAKTLDQTTEIADQLPYDQFPIKPEYSSYNSEPQLSSLESQYESQPQELESPNSGIFNRFSPHSLYQKPKNLNKKPFPGPEAQKLTTLTNGQQDFSPVQIPPQINQQQDINTFDAFSENTDESKFLSPSHYPTNFPNRNNSRVRSNEPISYNYEPERPIKTQPINLDPKVTPPYSMNNPDQIEDSFEQTLPLYSNPSPKGPGIERAIDQAMSDSPPYDDYDQVLFEQLPNEKLLEYDEETLSNLNGQKDANVQTDLQQYSDMTEQPLDDLNNYQDKSSPNHEATSFPSSPAHSNPLIQTLEHHLSFPMHEHLRPHSFSDPERESPNDSFPFDPQNKNEFRNASAVPLYSEKRNFEDVVKAPQSEFHALVSDPNTPSNKPGEDCVSCSAPNPTPLMCPFDPVLKGNMTAPSYYILISKLPVDEHGEEQFKVEKVYLGDGTPLNCTLSTGKTFPTWLYTPIPFSEAGTVKLRTKSDFA